MFKKSAVLMGHLPRAAKHDGRNCHIASKHNGRDGSELFCLDKHGGFLTISCVNCCVISSG